MTFTNNKENNNNKSANNVSITNRVGSDLQAKQKDKNIKGFVEFAFPRNYNVLRHLGLDKEAAIARGIDMTMQQGLES